MHDIAVIYGHYDMFRQADGGDEQLVFVASNGKSARRSFALLGQLVEQAALPQHGRALDVGCGNGAMLKAIAAFAPGWELHGSEQSRKTLPRLQKIPGFAHLHTGPVAEIAPDYDLVTLSHSLEHFLDPAADLKKLSERLTDDGLLIVQVPDCSKNFYDLLVADHRSHFTVETLQHCAARAGLDGSFVTDRLVPKELTLVAARSKLRLAALRTGLDSTIAALEGGERLGTAELSKRIGWFNEVQDAARGTARSSERFGIFGTSIAASWLFGGLQDATSFFIDEDPSRIGNLHEGRPILAPKDTPAKASVFLCLMPAIAQSVAARLMGETSGRLVLPPAYES